MTEWRELNKATPAAQSHSVCKHTVKKREERDLSLFAYKTGILSVLKAMQSSLPSE
jgi:hypothetical protein